MRVNYVIVLVADMARAVAFYRDVLELPLRFESSHWTEFATEGTTVALHLSEEGAPSGDRVKDERGGQCRPGFSVQDLDEFHRRMVEGNVSCIQPPSEVFGARVAQYADPDGLVISVGEDARRG